MVELRQCRRRRRARPGRGSRRPASQRAHRRLPSLRALRAAAALAECSPGLSLRRRAPGAALAARALAADPCRGLPVGARSGAGGRPWTRRPRAPQCARPGGSPRRTRPRRRQAAARVMRSTRRARPDGPCAAWVSARSRRLSAPATARRALREVLRLRDSLELLVVVSPGAVASLGHQATQYLGTGTVPGDKTWALSSTRIP